MVSKKTALFKLFCHIEKGGEAFQSVTLAAKRASMMYPMLAASIAEHAGSKVNIVSVGNKSVFAGYILFTEDWTFVADWFESNPAISLKILQAARERF